jgi:hypothetical protein
MGLKSISRYTPFKNPVRFGLRMLLIPKETQLAREPIAPRFGLTYTGVMLAITPP